MANAKKMILIEPSVLEKLKQRDSSPEDSLSRLDEDMRKIIKSKLNDREKWSLYLQTLQRYLHFYDEKKKSLNIDVGDKERVNKVDVQVQTDALEKEKYHDKVAAQIQTDSVALKETSAKDASRSSYSVTNILELIPKTYKKRGQMLMDYLLKNQDKIRWDDNGTVFVYDRDIPFSNISQLVNNVLRKLKRPQPLGWEEFAKVLSDIKIPIKCIGNPNTQEFLNKICVGKKERSNHHYQITATPRAQNTSVRLKPRKKIDWERWTPY